MKISAAGNERDHDSSGYYAQLSTEERLDPPPAATWPKVPTAPPLAAPQIAQQIPPPRPAPQGKW